MRDGLYGVFLRDSGKRTGDWIAIVRRGPIVDHIRLRVDQLDAAGAEAAALALIESLGLPDLRDKGGT